MCNIEHTATFHRLQKCQIVTLGPKKEGEITRLHNQDSFQVTPQPKVIHAPNLFSSRGLHGVYYSLVLSCQWDCELDKTQRWSLHTMVTSFYDEDLYQGWTHHFSWCSSSGSAFLRCMQRGPSRSQPHCSLIVLLLPSPPLPTNTHAYAHCSLVPWNLSLSALFPLARCLAPRLHLSPLLFILNHWGDISFLWSLAISP
jgi:hypothetical protein